MAARRTKSNKPGKIAGMNRSTKTGRYVASASTSRQLSKKPGRATVIPDGPDGWQIVHPGGTALRIRSVQRDAIEAALESVRGSELANFEEESAAASRIIQALLDQVTEAGGALKLETQIGSADAVAERMLSAVPGGNVLDARVGPFYDTGGLSKWFNMRRQTLHAQAKTGDVLCVKSGDGQNLYPSFQFDTNGNLLPRLREMLAAIDPERIDLWGDAMWLNGKHSALDGMTPAEALRTDRADDAVALAKRAGAHQFA